MKILKKESENTELIRLLAEFLVYDLLLQFKLKWYLWWPGHNVILSRIDCPKNFIDPKFNK